MKRQLNVESAQGELLESYGMDSEIGSLTIKYMCVVIIFNVQFLVGF